jgi:hypothetical protein
MNSDWIRIKMGFWIQIRLSWTISMGGAGGFLLIASISFKKADIYSILRREKTEFAF